MAPIHVNGKWLAQRMTGTQRYADEIVRAIIATDTVDLVVHVPAGVQVPPWLNHPRVAVRHSRGKGIVFEQVCLPIVTFGGLLLNLAGPAPLLAGVSRDGLAHDGLGARSSLCRHAALPNMH